jgi:hypothetical protein
VSYRAAHYACNLAAWLIGPGSPSAQVAVPVRGLTRQGIADISFISQAARRDNQILKFPDAAAFPVTMAASNAGLANQWRQAANDQSSA